MANYKNAISYFKKAIEVRESISFGLQSDIASMYINLGSCYGKLGNNENSWLHSNVNLPLFYRFRSTFDHSLIEGIDRPYFLAGGLTAQNVKEAIKSLHPYAVDASSCLETDGRKDKSKMTEFVRAIRS